MNEKSLFCCYCGIPEELLVSHQDKKKRMLTIDRKDSNRGYCLDNICLACFRCNNSKSDFFTHKEWEIVANQFIKPRFGEYHRAVLDGGE